MITPTGTSVGTTTLLLLQFVSTLIHSTLAIDDLHAQHAMHNIYTASQEDHVPEFFAEDTKHWLLVVLVVVSFFMLAYVFTLAHEAEKKEQKNK